MIQYLTCIQTPVFTSQILILTQHQCAAVQHRPIALQLLLIIPQCPPGILPVIVPQRPPNVLQRPENIRQHRIEVGFGLFAILYVFSFNSSYRC